VFETVRNLHFWVRRRRPDEHWQRTTDGCVGVTPPGELERAFGQALARALASDVSANPPDGPVMRVIVRWFEAIDPLYFTVHVLGADDQPGLDARDAWSLLEWANLDRELERTGRVREHDEVQRAGSPLTRDDDDELADVDEEDGLAPPAILEAVRAIPSAFHDAGIALGYGFAVSASHFEGHGALATLGTTAEPARLRALRDLGLLPEY
jgi:hypothetical protein